MSDAVDMSLTKDSAGRGYGHASWLMKTDATGCAADWLIVPFAENWDSLVHGTATDSQGNVYAVGSKCREATAEEKAQGATGGASEWGSAGTNVCSAFVGKYAAADGAALWVHDYKGPDGLHNLAGVGAEIEVDEAAGTDNLHHHTLLQ